jgi:hypothetical protein
MSPWAATVIPAPLWCLLAVAGSCLGAPPMQSLLQTVHSTLHVTGEGSPVFRNPWTTEHHDARNSGRSTAVYGVGTYNGTCQIAAAHALTGSFPASGVTSSDGRSLYVGR